MYKIAKKDTKEKDESEKNFKKKIQKKIN